VTVLKRAAGARVSALLLGFNATSPLKDSSDVSAARSYTGAHRRRMRYSFSSPRHSLRHGLHTASRVPRSQVRAGACATRRTAVGRTRLPPVFCRGEVHGAALPISPLLACARAARVSKLKARVALAQPVNGGCSGRLMRTNMGAASRSWAVPTMAMFLLLLPLCAHAGNGVHVGNGLYSGGNSLFDINASACLSRYVARRPTRSALAACVG